MINEIMASNQTTIKSPTGAFSDWVELLNPSPTEINLAGYFVSDRPDLAKKWQIPSSLIIPAGGHLLLWCDGHTEAGPAHLPFSLSASGESFLLTAPDGVTRVDRVDFPRQFPDISYGRADSQSAFRFLVQPTPGGRNNPDGVAFLSGVTFSHDSGTITSPLALELSTLTPGANIRYTLDGSMPTATHGFTYQTPTTISTSTTVRATLFLDGIQLTPVESRIFLALNEDLAGFDSNLPIVLIDSLGYDFSNDATPSTNYPAQPVSAAIFDLGNDGRAAVSGSANFLGRAGMNVRGASSKTWPKKQFKFETWDETDDDLDVSLLGLPAESD